MSVNMGEPVLCPSLSPSLSSFFPFSRLLSPFPSSSHLCPPPLPPHILNSDLVLPCTPHLSSPSPLPMALSAFSAFHLPPPTPQMIDGEAFLLLTQADIVKIMSVKLGPALKIYNAILMFKNADDTLK